MRLGFSTLPKTAVAPDIVDAAGAPSVSGWKVPGNVTELFTGATKAYQDYLNTRAQIETARLQAKANEARLKAQYKRAAGGGASYYPGVYSAPMKAGTKTMLMIGAGVLAVIAIGYTVIEKKKGKR